MQDNNQVEEKPKIKPKRSASGKPILYTSTLMEIFNFTESALNMNRNGFAANFQKDVVQEDVRDDVDSVYLMLMILLGTSVVLALIMRSQGIPMQYLAITLGILLTPLLLMAYRRQANARQDLEDFKVRVIEGKPQIVLSYRGADVQAQLQIRDQRFDISPYAAQALQEFDMPRLRLYYAENSHIVLSAEVAPIPTSRLALEDTYDVDDDYIIQAGRKYDESEA